MTAFDPIPLRAQFPALTRRLDGEPVVFLDGPGGTQVPQRVIDAYASYFREHNANTHGAFVTSAESDRVIDAAHAAMEDFLGAPPGSVKFGPNMTTLTFMLSRAIGRLLGPGDDIVVTRLDHDANVSPWTLMAADAGATVRWVDIDPSDCTLDLTTLDAALEGRPRLVAVGMASNATGTINPVRDIVRRAHAAGAWTFVDAVHYAPHGPIDVEDLETDFLACSIYKFFGPHLGVLYGRPEQLAALAALPAAAGARRLRIGHAEPRRDGRHDRSRRVPGRDRSWRRRRASPGVRRDGRSAARRPRRDGGHQALRARRSASGSSPGCWPSRA